jgi:hypothetical protein
MLGSLKAYRVRVPSNAPHGNRAARDCGLSCDS